jgi:hypothetical protein
VLILGGGGGGGGGGAQSTVSAKPAGTLQIQNNDAYINITEAGEDVLVKVLVEEGVTISSVRLGSQTLASGTLENTFVIDPSSFSDGSYTLVANLVVAPTFDAVSIEGEANGLNAGEVSRPLKITADLSGTGVIDAVTLSGQSLTQDASGSFVLDASGLSEGAHTLTVTARDEAGNTTDFLKSFTVDLDGPTDATINFNSVDAIMSASEADGVVSGSVELASGQALQSLTLNGSSVNTTSGNAFQFDAAGLSEGIHTLSVTTTSGVTSSTTFEIDRTAPDVATLSTVGDNFSITAAEGSSSLPIFVSAGLGSSVSSVTMNGASLPQASGGGVYTVNTSSLGVGVHDLVATTRDAAGNTASVLQKFVVQGSGAGSKVLEVEGTSGSAGLTRFDVYVVDLPSAAGDSLSGFDMTFDFDQSEFSYAAGSLTIKPGGRMGMDVGLASSGLLGLSAAYSNAFSDFEAPIATFYATNTGGVSSTSLRLYDVMLDSAAVDAGNYSVIL